MGMRPVVSNTQAGTRAIDLWPLREIPALPASPARDHSNSVIDDMVSVLSGKEHGSTAEALAFLRQLYPRYPLTLRLAAIVAHSKTSSALGYEAAQRPVAQ